MQSNTGHIFILHAVLSAEGFFVNRVVIIIYQLEEQVSLTSIESKENKNHQNIWDGSHL